MIICKFPCGCIIVSVAEPNDYWEKEPPPDTYWQDAAGFRRCLNKDHCHSEPFGVDIRANQVACNEKAITEGWKRTLDNLPDDWFTLPPDVKAQVEKAAAAEKSSQEMKFCLCQFPCENWGKGPCSNVKGVEYMCK